MVQLTCDSHITPWRGCPFLTASQVAMLWAAAAPRRGLCEPPGVPLADTLVPFL